MFTKTPAPKYPNIFNRHELKQVYELQNLTSILSMQKTC